MSNESYTKVSLNVRNDLLDKIVEHAQACGVNKTTVIHKALVSYFQLLEEKCSGSSILLKRPNGKMVEVIFK